MSATLFSVLLLLGPAGLEDNANFAAGQAFYNDIEFEQAIVKFQIALGDPSLSSADRATILLWTGVTYGQLGDDVTARQSFKDAFALDPEAALPDIIPPTLRPIAEEEQAAARQAAAETASAAEQEREAARQAAEAAAEEAAAQAIEASERTDEVVTEADPAGDGGLPWLMIGGGITAASGLVALAGAGAAIGWGINSFLFATDSSNFQSDADAAVLQMNVAWVAAGGFSVVALGLVGGGAALAATDVILE